MPREDVLDDQEARYLAAVERERLLRARWVRLRKPVTSKGGATGKALVVHPLLREIQYAEAHAQKLGRELGKVAQEGRGRPKASSSAPDRARPGTLRVVS